MNTAIKNKTQYKNTGNIPLKSVINMIMIPELYMYDLIEKGSPTHESVLKAWQGLMVLAAEQSESLSNLILQKNNIENTKKFAFKLEALTSLASDEKTTVSMYGVILDKIKSLGFEVNEATGQEDCLRHLKDNTLTSCNNLVSSAETAIITLTKALYGLVKEYEAVHKKPLTYKAFIKGYNL